MTYSRIPLAACFLMVSCLAVSCLAVAPASARHAGYAAGELPFTETLSNNTPLAFGMAEYDAARALNTPLTYITGRPGSEILLAIRTSGGSGFFDRRNRLYLQFRNGRLTGWKGDWGRRWIWQ